MKVGDLIKWTNYINENPISHIGLYLRKNNKRATFADIIVLHNGQEVEWVSWQCEVVS